MPSKPEAVILALKAALDAHSADVQRSADLPERIPQSGLINLVPADPQEEGERLSVGVREWSRVVELEHVVKHADEVQRNAMIDALLSETTTLLLDNRLGGEVDFIQIQTPQDVDEVPVPGSATAKGAVLEVILFFETTRNPMEANT